MSAIAQPPKMPKLIVVVAFDRGEDGELAAVFGPAEQQIEQHARNVERIHRDAIVETGRELSQAQELFKYTGNKGGFTGWLAVRLPHMSQSGAYRAIEAFKGIDIEMFPSLGKLSDQALLETAKAEPDIKAIIADRVEAGEVFTAAQVKDIKDKAAKEFHSGASG